MGRQLRKVLPGAMTDRVFDAAVIRQGGGRPVLQGKIEVVYGDQLEGTHDAHKESLELVFFNHVCEGDGVLLPEGGMVAQPRGGSVVLANQAVDETAVAADETRQL